MSRKLFKWLNKDGRMLTLAIMLLVYILVHIIFANHFRIGISLEEKIIVGIGLIGSLLWIRIEFINISEIEYNDAIERVEKLYYDQCRFERAICEKFNVVYRQDEHSLETFYDKKEYFEKEYKRAKSFLENDKFEKLEKV